MMIPSRVVEPGKAEFSIANLPILGDAILAPMDGFSDWPFRSLCRQLGSAMSYTEFIKAEFLVQAFTRMEPRMRFDETERPVAIQIYGENPEEVVQASGYHRHQPGMPGEIGGRIWRRRGDDADPH